MNLFREYLEEREGVEIIETPKGFISFKFIPEGCFICDYFVKPENRRTGEAYKMADTVFMICKERGIKEVFCQSDKTANGHAVAMKSILNYGFEIIGENKEIIEYKMGVQEWAKKSKI